MYSFADFGDWYEFAAEKPGARTSFYLLPYHILGKTFSEICGRSEVYIEVYSKFKYCLSDNFFYYFCEGLSVGEICRKGKDGYRASSAIYRSLDQDIKWIGVWLSAFSEFDGLISQIRSLLASKYDSLPLKPSTRAEWNKFKTKCTNDLKPFVRESLEEILPVFCAKWNEQAQQKSTERRF